MFIWGKHFMT